MPEKLQEQYPNVESLLLELKLQLRYFDLHITIGGKEVYKPKSINFASMDNIQFEKFYNEAFNMITKRFLTGMSESEFEKEIKGFS